MMKKVGNFFFCLGVILAVSMTQIAIAMEGMMIVAVALRMQNRDNASYMDRYYEIVQTSPLMTYLELAAVVAALGVVVPWYYLGYVQKDKEAGRYDPVLPRLMNIKSILFLITGGISCFSIAGVLEVLAEWLMPDVAEQLAETMNMMLNGNIFIGLFAAVILAPICEEIAVRGLILQHSKRVHGIVGCMILSAFWFSVFHMNPIQGLYVIPMGLFWAYVGYRFNSVIPCILCHMINNSLGTFMGTLLDPGEYVVVYLIMFVVFGAIAVWIGTKVPWKEKSFYV